MNKPNLYCFNGRLGMSPNEIKLAVSPRDRARFDRLPKRGTKRSVVVTDLNTGITWRVRRAYCGANCYCAAEATKIK